MALDSGRIYFSTSRPRKPQNCEHESCNSRSALLVQYPTQCTDLFIYFASLPYIFRAYIQPIIKRLRVQCGNGGTSAPSWTIDSLHLRRRSSLPHEEALANLGDLAPKTNQKREVYFKH
jgi:hypothetical protein